MSKPFYRREDRRVLLFWGSTAAVMLALVVSQLVDFKTAQSPSASSESSSAPRPKVSPLEGKTRVEGDRQYLWAKGPRAPEAESSEWFDLTGSPLPLRGFNHGIGRDTIPSIDHPVFVKADDRHLRLSLTGHEYGDISRLQVIGFEHDGVARAYPIGLLNRHELVNDTIGGKPITVGW